MTHLHWIIIAHEGIAKGSGEPIGATKLDLISDSYDEAMARAKKLAPKKKVFDVELVVEHEPHHTPDDAKA